ncbi:hypothetical protein [Bailinhaonella thermotolerans]|uniref:Uncharacterized protein n=1 Tax=Bailinhaonella thermotolerans TaxID=1070861 RepID=A0A3A4BBY1_9ACTN|nr:hypothetical protein [Bailinhaonella thermotolerans]RJL35606.1 hypothetical protein D5H75_02110 [Bailinhaonella thermotolerans]
MEGVQGVQEQAVLRQERLAHGVRLRQRGADRLVRIRVERGGETCGGVVLEQQPSRLGLSAGGEGLAGLAGPSLGLLACPGRRT